MRRLAACALLLAGCAAQPPPVEKKLDEPAPVVVPVAPRPPRQVISTTWSFDSRTDECLAVAASGRTSLQVIVRRNAPIQLAVSLPRSLPPGKPARWYCGSAGLPATGRSTPGGSGSRQLTAVLGSDDTALSRVLVLLSGGLAGGGRAGSSHSLVRARAVRGERPRMVRLRQEKHDLMSHDFQALLPCTETKA